MPVRPSRVAGFFGGAGQMFAHAARVLAERLVPRPTTPESPDVATGHVLFVLFGWTLFVAAALAGFGWYTAGKVKLSAPSQDVHALPAPRLQVDPAADFDRLMDMQSKRLAAYAWVDRDKGLVQIPIERAMEILVARGDRAFAPLAPPDPNDPREQAVKAATAAGASR